jgi:uncharacterized protein
LDREKVLKKHVKGAVINIRVQPRAKKNSLAGIHDGHLKIRLTAPPVDGAANKMCIAYLSKIFKRSRSCFEIISGKTSRTKRVLVEFSRVEAGQKNAFHDLNRKLKDLLIQ